MDWSNLLNIVYRASQIDGVRREVGADLLKKLEEALGIKPTKVAWGAYDLYIDLPSGISVRVQWRV